MKILWAIDSQCLDEGVQQCAIAAVRSLAIRANAEVFPIYVYFPSSIELSTSFDADGLRWVREQAQGTIDRLLAGTQGEGIKPVKVLLQLPAAHSNPLASINAYGESIGADVVLAATHARTGYPRLVHGSFVETLLLHSSLPLLTVSPKTRPNGRFHDLLFATDFSADAGRAFPHALAFAKDLGLQVILFHLGSGGGTAAPLLEAARAAGVPCSVIEETGSGATLSSRLMELASTPGRILAMATHSDPSTPGVGTSVTRMLMEQSPAPLWCFHPTSHPRSTAGTAAAI